MRQSDQRDLFPASPKPVMGNSISNFETFDFLHDGDATRCVPDPSYVPPAHLALPSDDPEWMPRGMFG
jgi:hypothetical protein